MITQEIFEHCVQRAALAPTVHNTQPARWMRDGNKLTLFCDTDVGLTICDPSGRDAALSCGAVLEGMVLALSAYDLGADVTLTGRDTAPGQGLVVVAHLAAMNRVADGLHTQLERRFTWRGAFKDTPADIAGWTRDDTRLVLDRPNREWLAERNDRASFQIMQSADFRKELVKWMRLRDGHPRAGVDGMDRGSMNMSHGEAHMAPFALITFWKLLNALGLTRNMTSETEVTLTAPAIAVFHRDIDENPVVTGRAYLRLCLEASSLGFAGWPMAALSDHPATNREICDRFGIPADRRFIQAIRFGIATGPAPARARRPLSEILR